MAFALPVYASCRHFWRLRNTRFRVLVRLSRVGLVTYWFLMKSFKELCLSPFHGICLAQAVLKVTPEVLAAGQNLINEVKSNRAAYLLEKGESQDATKLKDAAFAKLDDWMSEFYAVARIALEDRPQLLEALSKTVMS